MISSKHKKQIKGKRILVTGGTGSFGKMFISKILGYAPKEIIVFSRDEDKQGRMRLEMKGKPVRFVLGDIRDPRSIREALRGVDIVIHAAALKWIPEVEYNVWEGVKTNVVGIQNILEAAKDENVQKVIALSTDKAVSPINAYGMTKALQERLVTTANLYNGTLRTVFVSTRYGNVLGSRGSVVPHFLSLIQQNKPLTITDPKMTRFLLTLSESVDLVLEALTEGVGGEIFVKQMPAHTIGDLADIFLEEFHLPKSMKKITGIRPGEKIHEVLVGEYEGDRTVVLGEYYVILPQIALPALEKKYKEKKRLGSFLYTSNTTKMLSKKQLHAILKKEKFLL